MFGNMGDMMKQIGDLKKQMKELKKTTAESTSRNGEVTVKVNGEMRILEIKLGDKLNIKDLPILIRDTANQALHEVKMKSAGSLNLDGLKLPGM
jgi:DNA-binding protein YbaB